MTFPDTTGPGISYALSGLTSATRSRTYTFTPASTLTAVPIVAAADRATNAAAATFRLTRDVAPPTLALTPAVEGGALRVTWSSSDAASGVDAGACELRVQEDEGAWQPFSTACAGDEVHTAAQPGHVYTFRLSASDNVSNGASTEALVRFPRVTKYYYHGSTRVAMRADGVVYYLHTDHLGSTSLTTDQNQQVVARQLYHPYGTVRWQDGTLPTDFGFTGQRGHPDLGLVFMHARYYHVALGRFISADTLVPNPLNPQLLNRYSYAGNNPVLYADPSGHNPILGLMLIAAGVAALAVEVHQISSYAEAHEQGFWETVVDPDFHLDQAAMVDAAIKGAMVVPMAVGGVQLLLAGGGDMLQQGGMWFDSPGAWNAGGSLHNAAAGWGAFWFTGATPSSGPGSSASALQQNYDRGLQLAREGQIPEHLDFFGRGLSDAPIPSEVPAAGIRDIVGGLGNAYIVGKPTPGSDLDLMIVGEQAPQLTARQLQALNSLAQQSGYTDAHVQTLSYIQAAAFRFATQPTTPLHAVPNLRNPMLWRLINGE